MSYLSPLFSKLAQRPLVSPASRPVRRYASVALAALGLALPALTQYQVVGWGEQSTPLPWTTDVVDVEVSWAQTFALRANGSIEAWGENQLGQCLVPPLPAGVAYTE